MGFNNRNMSHKTLKDRALTRLQHYEKLRLNCDFFQPSASLNSMVNLVLH